MRRIARRVRALTSLLAGPKPAILMYHRIASPQVDPWGLSVTPENLRSQLRSLRRHRQPLSMDAFVERLSAGKLPANAVALTFDDGYIDNLVNAKPILEEEGVPATVLVTTGSLGSSDLFWWDELARLILLSRDAVELTLAVGGHDIAISIPAASPQEIRPQWRAWEAANGAREQLYFDLWSALQRLDAAERDAAIATLARKIGAPPVAAVDLAMTREDLAALPSAMMSVGAHGVTHRPLSAMPAERQSSEMQESRAVCETIAGCRISGFAYPHGDADDETRRIARELGFDWACSTHSSAVSVSNYDLFDLPRIAVPNVPGSALLHHIRAQT